MGRRWANRDGAWSPKPGAQSPERLQARRPGQKPSQGGLPCGPGRPCSQQVGDPQSGHSCDLGSPQAEGSSPVAGQVSTRPGRADTPETPEAQAGTRPQMPLRPDLTLPAPTGACASVSRPRSSLFLAGPGVGPPLPLPRPSPEAPTTSSGSPWGCPLLQALGPVWPLLLVPRRLPRPSAHPPHPPLAPAGPSASLFVMLHRLERPDWVPVQSKGW